MGRPTCWYSNCHGGCHGNARNGEIKGETKRQKIEVCKVLGRPSSVERQGGEREDRGG